MKKVGVILLAVLLVCSVVLNIYLVAKESSNPVLSGVPTDPTGDIQASGDDAPTLVELEMIKSMISTSLFGLRGSLDRQWFMTDSSYQRVYDLVYNLYACSVDTDRRVVKVEFINLTDEIVETFDMIFRNEDYIEIINLGEGTIGSYVNTLGGVSNDPTEVESPSAEELYMVQNSISCALASLRDLPREHFKFASGYADVNALASSYCGGHVDTERNVVVIEIKNLTDEKIKTFKKLFSDAEYIVLEEYELTTESPVGGADNGSGAENFNPEGTALDTAALAELQLLFDDYYSWYSMATTDFYEDPTQIDLNMLFYNGFRDESREVTESELSFLTYNCGRNAYAMSKIRIPVDKMEAVLSEYFNISLE